jgi:starvation-inducible DNA-binding protein
MENKLFETLNKQVANWTVLYSKLHTYHWYVTGPHFFTLHPKFEEFYTEAAAHVDVLAERVLTLGGKPVANLSGCMKVASIIEATGEETAEQMVENLISDFSKMMDELKQAMEIADQAEDEETYDMLLAIRGGLEKHNWMLKAFLQ